MKMEVVGKSVKRSDARKKVTGTAKYIADYKLDGMLYGSTLRSPYPHIRIKRLDTKRAESLAGVVAIVTAKDVPGENIVPLVLKDLPLLAEKEALFRGQPIALVAAETKEIAEEAVRSIKLNYERLPAVTDPLEALGKKAPRIYGKDNVFSHYNIDRGNIARGFASAEVIVEEVYTTNYQVHAYLETQGIIGRLTPDGGMTIYGSMQCPFYVHDAIAQVLGFPQNKVRIVQTTIGGAFGGKEDVPSIVAGHAALLSYYTKRPVKFIYDREEDFLSMSKRHPGWARVKYGARRDGTLVACDIDYILDGGAYGTLSPIVLWRGAIHAAGAYNIPHVRIRSRAVATNRVPCGAFRGFGQPQIAFAQESAIDELATKLGIDPLTFRQKNRLKKGDLTATSQQIKEKYGLEEGIRKARAIVDWQKKWNPPAEKKGKLRSGLGVAVTYYGVGLGAGGRHLDRAAAHVQVEKDGTVIVAVGNTDMGQGAGTVLAQITAEALNASYEMVNVLPVDSTRVPDSGPTVASRTTLMSGNAIIDACRPISKNIRQAAATLLGIKEKDIVAAHGLFSAKKGKKKISFRQAAGEAYIQRLKMSAQGWYVAPFTSSNPKDGQGDSYVTYTFSVNIAEVEVDLESCQINVKRIVAAHDIGRAINPQLCQGQIEGGVLQGVGYGIMENLVNDKGIILNPNLTGYIIPTISDSPPINPIIVESSYKEGPYGARGLGEPPLIGVAPAIANAVYNATGIRMRSLPMLPEKLFAEVKKS
jgi:CO/xanthine dehydrogenase Mo-binding subunit